MLVLLKFTNLMPYTKALATRFQDKKRLKTGTCGVRGKLQGQFEEIMAAFLSVFLRPYPDENV